MNLKKYDCLLHGVFPGLVKKTMIDSRIGEKLELLAGLLQSLGKQFKRDGLKVGTPAPDFRLPRLDGRGDLSLGELRGERVLLVFSDPHCGPCNALAPELEKFHRQQADRNRSPVAADRYARDPGEFDPDREGGSATAGEQPRSCPISVVMISRGEPKENRAKVKEHGLTFHIVVQRQWEISRLYAMFATPSAYFIDEQGVIVKDVAVGVEPILNLMAEAKDGTFQQY